MDIFNRNREAMISDNEARLMLRALRGHATRMLKIAENEVKAQNPVNAEVARRESAMAQELAVKLERQGVRMDG